MSAKKLKGRGANDQKALILKEGSRIELSKAHDRFDFTGQMAATGARETQEACLAGILDTAMDGIISINSQHRIVLFNKAAEQMFRCAARDAMGQSIERFIPERFRRDHGNHIRKFEQGEVSTRRMGALGEITGLRADGREFPAEASISKVKAGGEIMLTVICRDITARKVTEAGLQYLSRQHQILLNSTGEGIYGIDQQGHVTFYNRAAESMTGWKQEEIRGKFIHSVIHQTKPDGTPYTWEESQIYKVLTKGVERHVEDEVLWRKDGSSFHAAYRSNPLHDEKGKIFGAVVIFRDVTERKKIHLQLLALANRNRALLDSIPDLIVEVDVHRKMTWFNDEALKFYGPDALGKEPKEFFVGEQKTYEQVHPIFEGENAVIHLESWQRRKDGKSRLLEWWCRGLKDEQGKVVGALSTARDVTDRKHEAERLIESEYRFRTMVEHLPGGAIFTDGDIMLVNQAVLEMTGYSKAELSSLDAWFRLLHGPDESIMRKLYDKDKQGGFAVTRLLPIHRKDGVLRYAEFSRFGWDSGEVWLLHDVTDQHEAKIAILNSKEALERSQQELRALTAQLLTAQEDERRRVSRDLHDDMNQRLAVLALKIQSAQRGFDEPCSNCRILQDMYDEVGEISDDIRHLAYQLHPSVLDDLGLKQALQSLIDDFAKYEKIPITFTADNIPGVMSQDVSSCMYRLAQESLRNISKYARATHVKVTLAPLNKGIQLTIDDDGVGFDPESASLKKGLGLIGMQERVRLVRGTWSIQTRPGEGVTVSAWVPLQQERV